MILTQKQLDLLKKYQQYLLSWNNTHNLVSKSQTKNISQHIEDSLSIVSSLGKNLIDLGSGAGLPGIPIAIASPSKKIFLLESSSKKAAFLLHSTNKLKLKNTTIINARMEELNPGNFPIPLEIITRAFGTIEKTIMVSRRLLDNPKTTLKMMKTSPLKGLKPLPKDFHVTEIKKIDVKGKDKEHILVTIAKRLNV